MSLHFENTNLGPGFDVSMRLKQFFNRDGQTEIGPNGALRQRREVQQ